VGDKWTLLIVRDLAAGPRRFVELQRVLPGISTEQLRSRLNRMVADEMLTRKRYREVPPRVEYELTERARELMPVLGELAKWGYEWAWGPPRESETVDVSAIFRLAPGLIPANGNSGTVEFAVEEGGVRLCYCCAVSSDGVVVEEKQPREPDARVTGTRSDWVRALLPEHDRAGLDISGDRPLAEALLAHLAAERSRKRNSRATSPASSATSPASSTTSPASSTTSQVTA
jgi:DNA-binding HxlR family transcriptional regulator